MRNAALAIGGALAGAGHIVPAKLADQLVRARQPQPPTAQHLAGALQTAQWGLKAGHLRPITLEDRPFNGIGRHTEHGDGARAPPPPDPPDPGQAEPEEAGSDGEPPFDSEADCGGVRHKDDMVDGNGKASPFESHVQNASPHDGASMPYDATAALPPPPPEPPGAQPRVRLEAMIHTDAADQPQHESGRKIPRPNGQDALLQVAIGRLARLPEVEYDLIDYTAEAERLGLDGVSVLKRAVGRARKAAEAAQKARAKAAAAEAKAKAKTEEEARIRAETPPPLTPAQIATEIERLAGLNPIDYNRERIHAKKRLGFTRVELLDLKVGQIRQERLRENPLPPAPTPDTIEVKALIAEFNAKYIVVNEDGRALIYAPKRDPDQNRRFFERLSFADLDKLYLNRTVLTGVR